MEGERGGARDDRDGEGTAAERCPHCDAPKGEPGPARGPSPVVPGPLASGRPVVVVLGCVFCKGPLAAREAA